MFLYRASHCAPNRQRQRHMQRWQNMATSIETASIKEIHCERDACSQMLQALVDLRMYSVYHL